MDWPQSWGLFSYMFMYVRVSIIILSIHSTVYCRMDENAVEDHARVTILTLHKWCEQIASGMEYLAQKQVALRHRAI